MTNASPVNSWSFTGRMLPHLHCQPSPPASLHEHVITSLALVGSFSAASLRLGMFAVIGVLFASIKANLTNRFRILHEPLTSLERCPFPSRLASHRFAGLSVPGARR